MFIPRRKLHKEGPEVSELIYGFWRLADDPKGVHSGRILEKIKTCLDLGITSFDHADVYGNYSCEELFGNVLRQNKDIYKRIEIITKCGIQLPSNERSNRIKHYDTTKEHLLFSAESSIERLGVEKIDIFLVHRPDPLLDPTEIAEAFTELKRSGKVLYFGVSNFSASQFEMLQSYLDFPLVTNQIEINPLKLNSFLDGTLDLCLKNRIRPMGWGPYAGGKLFRSNDPKAVRVREVLYRLAKDYNASLEEIVLSWLTTHPAGILPILGTNQIDRIQIVRDYKSIRLTRQDWFEIWRASIGEELF